MATKISELTAAGAIDGTEQVPIVQGGTTKRTTIGDINAELSGAYVAAFGICRTHNLGSTLSLAGVATANNRFYFRVLEGGTISKVRTYVGTQSGNISVAAYSNTGTGLAAAPGTLLATSGSVACPAPGIADVALGSSVVLAGGDWLSLAADNTTATFLMGGDGGGLGNLTMFSGIVAYQTGAFTAPNPPSSLAPNTSRPFILVGVA